jgi:hypothetical protein
MDYDLASYAQQMPPEERQQMMAQLLRRQQQSEQMANAQASANQHGMLSAVAQMSNNEGAANAALMAHKNAQQRYKPVQMGQEGFVLPDSGEFVESPMRVDEKNAQRTLQRTLSRDKLDAQTQIARDREQSRADQADQNRTLRMTLAGMQQGGAMDRAQLLADSRAAAAGQQADKQTESNIQKYTNTLEKSGIPEFHQALSLVDGVLNKYKPGELPAYGRLKSMLPNAALSEEGQGVRADMQQAANILLKSRSGAAVTESEMRRFLQEVGSGAFMAEATLRKGWDNVRKTFEAKRQNITASIDGPTHDEYLRRGGTDFRPTPKADSSAPPAGVPTDAWKHMTPEERALWK